jgi:hypothetical protein
VGVVVVAVVVVVDDAEAVEAVEDVIDARVPFFWYIPSQDEPPQYSFGLAAHVMVQAPEVEAAEPLLIEFPQ